MDEEPISAEPPEPPEPPKPPKAKRKRRKKPQTPQDHVELILEDERVVWFPVKHYSPACAWHMTS